MERDLIEKVRDALLEACKPDAAPDIRLTVEPDGRITGFALSSIFGDMRYSDRQDLLWKHLDAKLTLEERDRVVFIAADTTEEYDAIQEDRLVG